MTEKEAKSSNFREPCGLNMFIKIMPHPHQNVFPLKLPSPPAPPEKAAREPLSRFNNGIPLTQFALT